MKKTFQISMNVFKIVLILFSLIFLYYVLDEIINNKENAQVFGIRQEENIEPGITISVIDDETNAINNVTIELYNNNKEILGIYTTDENGQIKERLEYGKYFIKQNAISEDFTTDNNFIEFEINENSKHFYKTFTHKKNAGQIYINLDIPFKDYTFVIYNEDKSFNKTVTTDSTGKAKLEKVPEGHFYIKSIYDKNNVNEFDITPSKLVQVINIRLIETV